MFDFILLIPVFNNPDGLLSSIKSVRYHSDKFQILIIDDGSSEQIQTEWLKTQFPNFNIELITLPINSGIVNALNIGLKHIHEYVDCKYIARLDCGDICTEDRFNKQVDFLDNNNDISLLGTWCRFLDKISGKNYLYNPKTIHKDITKQMHFRCSFIHPTVMFRTELLDTIGYYPVNFAHAEDYAYFWQILKKSKGEILPEVMVDVEMFEANVSSRNYKKQLLSRIKIALKFGDNMVLIYFNIIIQLAKFLIPKTMLQKIKMNFILS